MITKFKIYETKEIQNFLDELLKYKSYAPLHDDSMGWVSEIRVSDIKDEGIVRLLGEYLRWRYNFDDGDEINVTKILIPPLYDDLKVYNSSKKLLMMYFNTDRFAQSKHSITKGEFGDFLKFIEDPEKFKEVEKYNL